MVDWLYPRFILERRFKKRPNLKIIVSAVILLILLLVFITWPFNGPHLSSSDCYETGEYLHEEYEIITGLVIDSNGYLYISGTLSDTNFFPNEENSTIESTIYDNGILVKLSPKGTVLWVRLIHAEIQTLRIDTEDNIYLYGSIPMSSDYLDDIIDFVDYDDSNDIRKNILIKYNSSGVVIWVRLFQYSFPKDSNLFLDYSNNIVFTRKISGNQTDNTNIKKFSTSGEILWERIVVGNIPKYSIIDKHNNIIILGGGRTSSNNFPTKNALYTSFIGSHDIFLLKLDQNGNIVWSTYFGGVDSENPLGMVMDHNQHIIIYGTTFSQDFPLLNEYDDYIANQEHFVSSFHTNGSLYWSTYFDGDDSINLSLTVDLNGSVVIFGDGNLNRIPSSYPLINDFGHNQSAFIYRLSEKGESMNGSLIGGEDEDVIITLIITDRNQILLTGMTKSNDFPILNAYQENMNGKRDFFITKYNSTFNMEFSSYFGGNGTILTGMFCP